MKNIHLLPTDKPSRLCINGKNQQHIYITSDEKIKEGEYNVPSDFSKISDISKTSEKDLNVVNYSRNGYKKIILTTDPDLIKEGVQEIPDEFLEWLVKNPSCEEVEIEKDLKAFDNQDKEIDFAIEKDDYTKNLYKIIIPKEKPKQEIPWLPKETWDKYHQLKQKTLEETDELVDLCNKINFVNPRERVAYYNGLKNGAKWQAERMYSEIEDFINWIDEKEIPREDGVWIKYFDGKDNYLTTKELFEQFKKKV